MRITEKNTPFSNPLIHSSSLYLRQHSKNPVYWYPWGEQALRRAREEDKPILLSIGYSTCYWCHVMEREVFENLSIASQMNRFFINIKVDREEHPQIDDIYMHARQIMTHEGGWPNNVFLTPDLKPFYAGGTYGATENYGKPSFPKLIDWLHSAWETDRENVLKIADETTEMLRHFMVAKPPSQTVADFSPMIAAAHAALKKQHDVQSGGFYQSPKFPHENYLQFLLAHHEATGDGDSLDMAAFSLGRMAAGGINDQVGCGFHRYAVDRDWLVPHFEKMLYTQALLARCYTDAARLTGNPYFADVAKSICDFTIGILRDHKGGFFTAVDAENDEVEGAYYAWNPKEIESLLTEDELAFFLHHYGIAEIPNFPGHKHPDGDVLIARMPLYQAALAQKLPYEQIAAMSGAVMNKLLAARNKRAAPALDDKIIVAWNGLMIDALAHAGQVFSNRAYIEHARRAADYLLRHAVGEDGGLQRCIIHGRAGQPATLEDYAYFIRGLLAVHRASGDREMLAAARYLMTKAESLFGDNGQPGLFATQALDTMVVRAKNGEDATLPNPNAVMAENYLAFAALDHDAAATHKARAIVQFFLGGENKVWVEYAAMLRVAMQLQEAPIVMLQAVRQVPQGGGVGVEITLDIKAGWYLQPAQEHQPDGMATRISIPSAGAVLRSCRFPEPTRHADGRLVYEGRIRIAAQVEFLENAAPEIVLALYYYPCTEGACLGERIEVIHV